MSETWNGFFSMVGGGSATLAGLIFVAMSIKPETMVRYLTHKNRAVNMLSGFTAVFMACGFALIGNQSLRALGIEWFVLWSHTTAYNRSSADGTSQERTCPLKQPATSGTTAI